MRLWKEYASHLAIELFSKSYGSLPVGFKFSPEILSFLGGDVPMQHDHVSGCIFGCVSLNPGAGLKQSETQQSDIKTLTSYSLRPGEQGLRRAIRVPSDRSISVQTLCLFAPVLVTRGPMRTWVLLGSLGCAPRVYVLMCLLHGRCEPCTAGVFVYTSAACGNSTVATTFQPKITSHALQGSCSSYLSTGRKQYTVA